MHELELTYLAKFLPEDLKKHPSKEVADLYIPGDKPHPSIRLRKNGDKYELTKKEPIKDGDATSQLEQTIVLREDEYQFLSKLKGKKSSKIRYKYDYKGRVAEIDVFTDKLQGLVIVDFEFKKKTEMKRFQMPDFCLAFVGQEKFLAGGMLCGKTYSDIATELKKYDYKKL